MEIQEALIGQFGGFYVFGLTSDIDFSLNNSPVLLNLNGFIGGGGGSGALMDLGWLTGMQLASRALKSIFNLLARYSTYDLPTGNMASDQVQFGFLMVLNPYLIVQFNNTRIAKQSVSIQSLFVDLDTYDSERLDENYRSKFISVEYASCFTRNLEV